MRLATFRVPGDSGSRFGVVLGERILCSENLFLRDALSYLRHLPESEALAREVKQGTLFRLDQVKLLAPVPEPVALIDFSLAPRHLELSLKTFLKYECPWWGRLMVERFVRNGIKKKFREGLFPYYKANHRAVIGDGEETTWPAYASYLDIEPELAFVTGPPEAPVAGFTILNDWSARDVQWSEMAGGGLTRSKDFDRGYGMGPFLVTSDEIKDPLDLKVEVRIGERSVWEGSTSEYSGRPENVLDFIRTVFPPEPGMVIGMGAIPGCSGLDRDEWIQAGERIEMTFEGLGTLRQSVPRNRPPASVSRWKKK